MVEKRVSPAKLIAGLISSLFDNNLSDCTVFHHYKVEALLQFIQLLTIGRMDLDILRLRQNHLPDACGIACMHHHSFCECEKRSRRDSQGRSVA